MALRKYKYLYVQYFSNKTVWRERAEKKLSKYEFIFKFVC